MQGWDRPDKALQLLSSLKGMAVEVLGHLTGFQLAAYECIRAALEKRFCHQHQEGAFWARFRARKKEGSKSLQHLAQNIVPGKKSIPGGVQGVSASTAPRPVY